MRSGGGDFMKRPGMADMLKFLSKMNDDYVVIFDDLKRFARDTVFHLKLRQRLAAYNATVEMSADLWNHRLTSSEGKERALKNELKKIEKEVEQFLDRIADTNVPSVITAYENRIRKLEERKFVVQEKIAVGVLR